MQIEEHQSECPACGSAALDVFPVFHHMMCAYVGPQYDFSPTDRWICLPEMPPPHRIGRSACEIVGTSARCKACQREMVVSPPPARL